MASDDDVARFLDAECELSSEADTSAQALWAAYLDWVRCQGPDARAASRPTFDLALLQAGVRLEAHGRGWSSGLVYHGVALVPRLYGALDQATARASGRRPQRRWSDSRPQLIARLFVHEYLCSGRRPDEAQADESSKSEPKCLHADEVWSAFETWRREEWPGERVRPELLEQAITASLPRVGLEGGIWYGVDWRWEAYRRLYASLPRPALLRPQSPPAAGPDGFHRAAFRTTLDNSLRTPGLKVWTSSPGVRHTSQRRAGQ